ncbi:hypothetical protein N0V88_003903 [Collariella sp. IMI 366227]|nr:hypothetical protein N0V88_003903 [Collariella sp. IMI 366227]
MALTYQQAKLVRDTIPALREHGEQITTTFYRNMLRDHPNLTTTSTASTRRTAGNRAPDLGHPQLRLQHQPHQRAHPKFERMCNKHCSLGIQPEHYEIVGKYLLRAFGEVLGPAMTPTDFEKWNSWRKFKIDRIVPESDDIYSFYLVPQDGKKLPKFFPGQYVSLRIHSPEGYMQARQYSLSEAWREDYYRISVKRDEGARYANSVSKSYFHPGLVSNMLIDHMSAGAMVDLSHPAGDFFLDINNTSTMPLVLISAGVGVTPMIAIANTVSKTQPNRHISWVHGSRSVVPFEEHIAKMRRTHANFRTNVFKTHLAGSDVVGVTYDYDFRMDLAKVAPEDLYLHNSGTEYYICGPEQFMMEMSDYLKSQGVGAARVKFELFSTGDLAFKHTA